jgi:hypothetical protein
MRGFVELIRRTSRLGVAAILLLVSAASAAAGEAETAAPVIRPGTIELGLAGALTTVEGIQTGTLWVRSGMFDDALSGVIGAEVIAGYSHVSSLDRFDLAAAFSWGRRWGESGNYPYGSVSLGWRQQEVGSFSHARFPVGFGVGMRSLIGRRAGFRVEYAYRRVLNDPVADFNEHEMTIGLSVFFRNNER